MRKHTQGGQFRSEDAVFVLRLYMRWKGRKKGGIKQRDERAFRERKTSCSKNCRFPERGLHNSKRADPQALIMSAGIILCAHSWLPY